jgi:DNA-binding transcriptional regulator YhcF (GntR family)
MPAKFWNFPVAFAELAHDLCSAGSAYLELEHEGAICKRRGHGMFVSRMPLREMIQSAAPFTHPKFGA